MENVDQPNYNGRAGGIFATSAGVLIRNCLIAGNTAKGHGGGVYGGTVENCTVVRNESTDGASVGGGVYNSTVINSIVMDNTSGSGSDQNYGGSASFTYSCADPLPAGTGNISAQGFVDAASTNYQLLAGGAVDGGTNKTWMTGAVDLIGNPRLNGTVDMGAYEKVPGALEAGLSADVTTIQVGDDVIFTAAPSGGNTTLTYSHWTFGDGQVGDGLVVTNTYNTAGAFTVSLSISNTIGESASATNLDYILVYDDDLYVSAGSASAAPPYHTWSNAAATIDAALSVAPVGSTIVISNGTYNPIGEILVDKAVTLTGHGDGVSGGMNNASNTVVQRTGGTGGSHFRVFRITAAGAVLDGLTIAGGMGRSVPGLGINMTGGTVQNCIVRDNGDTSNASAAGLTSGGGIYMSGGVVSNCTVQANKIVENNGAGIYASGSSLIVHSRILENRNDPNYSGYGAGIYASGASVTIRNCLVAGNVGDNDGGGIYRGTVESCTVVRNETTDAGSVGGGVYNATVVNSVVMDNVTGSGGSQNYDGSSSLTYSCADPLPAGDGNINAQSFEDAASTNYQLQAGAAVDGGTNRTWMTGALDLIGNPRLSGAGNVVDMGAYEKVPGALEAGISADVTATRVASNVVFTAVPSGGNINLTYISWNFGDGQVGDGLVATNAYATPGTYTVSLSISNDTGESASATNVDYIAVWGDYAYVSQASPAPAAPYHTWSNASHSLPNAVSESFAGMTIVVSNGTYNVPSSIAIAKALTVTSFGNGSFGGLANASNTVVNHSGSSGRVFNLGDPDVLLDGLTITGGSGRGVSGKGVYMTGGLVRDCIVKENGSGSAAADGLSIGGGIYMTAGLVSNCTVEANEIVESNGGAGVYAQGASQILHSRIIDNKQLQGYDSSGGGIYASGSSVLIRNCLVAGNETKNSGGGIYGGIVESCTIVSNRTRAATGGGVYLTGSTSVKNSIVYFNTVNGASNDLNTTVGVTYSCAGNGNTVGGNITDDPLFEDLAGGDYRVVRTSPCIDAGDSSIVTWSTDLAGNARIADDAVEMGAFETLVVPLGTMFRFR